MINEDRLLLLLLFLVLVLLLLPLLPLLLVVVVIVVIGEPMTGRESYSNICAEDISFQISITLESK